MAGTTENEVRALVESKRQDIDTLLAGSGLSTEKFVSTVFQLWAKNSRDLSQCTRDSVLSSILGIADMGLSLTPSLAHAYIVKYGNVATPIVSYLGLIYMARRDGLVQDIRFDVRREGDEFSYDKLDTTRPIRHIRMDPPTGRTLGYWCVAYLNNGMVHGLYMSKEEIDRYKAAYSPNADRGPMGKNPDTYGLKTVIRQTLKYLQLGGKVSQAFAMGGETESAEGPNVQVEVTSAANDLDNPLPQLEQEEGGVTLLKNGDTISAEQVSAIMSVAKNTGWKISDLCSLCSAEFGVDTVEDLGHDQAAAFMTRLDQRP